MVAKKDETPRFCVDYCDVNNKKFSVQSPPLWNMQCACFDRQNDELDDGWDGLSFLQKILGRIWVDCN